MFAIDIARIFSKPCRTTEYPAVLMWSLFVGISKNSTRFSSAEGCHRLAFLWRCCRAQGHGFKRCGQRRWSAGWLVLDGCFVLSWFVFGVHGVLVLGFESCLQNNEFFFGWPGRVAYCYLLLPVVTFLWLGIARASSFSALAFRNVAYCCPVMCRESGSSGGTDGEKCRILTNSCLFSAAPRLENPSRSRRERWRVVNSGL